jgi:hypothetical protein
MDGEHNSCPHGIFTIAGIFCVLKNYIFYLYGEHNIRQHSIFTRARSFCFKGIYENILQEGDGEYNIRQHSIFTSAGSSTVFLQVQEAAQYFYKCRKQHSIFTSARRCCVLEEYIFYRRRDGEVLGDVSFPLGKTGTVLHSAL